MNLKKESKCHVGFLRSSLIRGNPLTHCLTPIPADPLHAGLVLASCPTGLAPRYPTVVIAVHVFLQPPRAGQTGLHHNSHWA